MKGFAPWIAALVAAVEATPMFATPPALERRQLGEFAEFLPLVTGFIPHLKPVSIERLPVELPFAKNLTGIDRLQIKYGPLRLRAPNGRWAGNMISLDPQGTGFAYMVEGFPSNVTLLAPQMYVLNEDGSPISNANRVYNHHTFIYDTARPRRANLLCQNNDRQLAAVNAIMGSAADFSPDSLNQAIQSVGDRQLKVGNYVENAQKLMMSVDLVNYNPTNQYVYVIADITYLEGKAIGYFETALHLISVGTCESRDFLGNTFIVPPQDKKQWQLKGDTIVRDDGRIMAIRGHMHDGGDDMILKVNGKVVCDSKAVYDASNFEAGAKQGTMSRMLSDMTMCLQPVDVKKGDVLTMEAYYDSEKHVDRDHPGGGMSEQMALMAVVFAEEIKA